MPRQSKRTPELEAEVLARLSAGEPLANICRDEHMPHMSTWRQWCRADEILDIAHGRARDDGFDAIAADTLEIADDDRRDWEALTDADGNVTGIRVDGEHVTRSKLRIETRLKLLAKWDPKRYGDRMTHAGDPDAPLNPRPLAGVSTQDLTAALARLGLGDAEPG